jgi:hypothetical protein
MGSAFFKIERVTWIEITKDPFLKDIGKICKPKKSIFQGFK